MKAKWIPPTVCVALAALLAVPAARADDDHDDGDHRRRGKIVGTWRVNLDLGFAQSFSLMVFDKSHTLTESNTNSSTLTGGSGVWEKTDDGGFAAMVEGWSDEDMDGDFDDSDIRFRVRFTLWVFDDDLMSGTGTFDVLTVDGTTILATPATGFPIEGRRMTVIPE